MDNQGKIEQYVLLAKGLRGLALCDLINKATGEPGLFVFGELLALPAMKEVSPGPKHRQDAGLRRGCALQGWPLSGFAPPARRSHLPLPLQLGSEHAAALSLLQLFAYGTWTDYASNTAAYPPLSPAQQHKLKLLTVATLAEGRRTLPYDELMQQLGLDSLRQLEDVLISDCIYGGLLKGRLDQKNRCLHVGDALARDVAPERLPEVAAALQGWLTSARQVLQAMEQRITWTAEASAAAEQRRGELEAAVQSERKSVQTVMQAQAQEVGGTAMDEGGEIFFNALAPGSVGPGGPRVTKRRR